MGIQHTWYGFGTYGGVERDLAEQARSADVVVVATAHQEGPFSTSRRLNVSDVVLRTGRPVILAPTEFTPEMLEKAAILWKDTREARRAAAAALPLLKEVSSVDVIQAATAGEVFAAEKATADVCAWLHGHDIPAAPFVEDAGHCPPQGLTDYASERGAGVVVAGFYGHSRLREWVLGGASAALLKRHSLVRVVSH